MNIIFVMDGDSGIIGQVEDLARDALIHDYDIINFHHPDFSQVVEVAQKKEIIFVTFFNKEVILHLLLQKVKFVVVSESILERFGARSWGVKVACSPAGLPYALALASTNI